ncbi:ribonuclease H-like domain-containing protein [Tanacetum coccineum]
MELENTQNNALAKLPMLKLGEYEMWGSDFNSFSIQDYALWEVIENGNSWVPIPVTPPPETWVWITYPPTKLPPVNPPEDLNVKFLRSLPSEWDTHVVVWTNKPDFDTMGLDDLYNNFKIVEQKVKKSAGASNDDKNSAFVTTSGASSTNNINTVNPEVSTCRYVATAIKWDILPGNAEHLGVKTTDWNLDGAGFDWSDMAEEEIQATWLLMAFSDSENMKFLFSEEIALLKRSVGCKEYELGLLRTELEKVKQEKKEGVDFKIAKFDKSAKDLNELLESQITDKSKKGVGHKEYHMGLLRDELEKVKQEKERFEFKIAKIDKFAKDLEQLLASLEEFKEPDVNEYGPRDSSLKPTIGCDKESDNSKENTNDSLEQHQITNTKTSSVRSALKVDKDWKEKFFYPTNQVREVEPKKVRENNDAPIIKDCVSDDEDDEPNPKVKKKTVIPTATKIEYVKPETLVKRSVRYAEMYRPRRPRGNQKNWNGQKSNQLGSNFVFNNKACFNCGSFDHIQYSCPNHQRKRIVSGNNYNKKDIDYYSKTSHSSAHKHMAPRAVLMKTGLKPINTARHVNNVRSVNTGRPFSTARERGFNAIKPSACWVWRPIKPNGASLSNSQLNNKGFVDSGCSRHMISKTLMEVMLLLEEEPMEAELILLVIISKFDGKSDEGFFVGYSLSSKAFRWLQELFLKTLQKDASYFGDAAPRSAADAQIQDKNGLQDENDAIEKSHDDSSLKDNGTVVQQVNTTSHASEDTQVEDQEVELGNIPQYYAVPTTPHTRIHKDHPIEHMIGDVQSSSVQTRRMTTSYSEQGFLSTIYEGKTH